MPDRQIALVAEALTTGTLTGLPVGHFIDGALVAPAAGGMMDSFDPGYGRAFATFAAGDVEDVDRAVTAAQRALAGWGRTRPAERGTVLRRIADGIRAAADRLAVVEALDSGKRLAEAQGDVRGAARAFDYYAGAADKLEGASIPLGSDYIAFTIDEPIGVVAIIVPWNYPLSTAVRGVAPALAAGCTIVLKPADTTPFSSLMLAEIALAAGLPPGVLNVITGTGAEVGGPLTAHAGVDHITFTGSVATGQRVMTAAAGNATRVALELGGKSPHVVLADANLTRTAADVMGAIYENAGQICSAGSRLIVEAPVHDALIERLVAATRSMRVGHGLTNPDLGAINSPGQLARIAWHVDGARSHGNHVLAGGKVVHPDDAASGWYYAPTIVTARHPLDPIVQDEIFGPVLTIQVAGDFDEAIALANCTDYALVAGIHTANLTRAYRFAREVDAGQVYINEFFAGGVETPFGGNRRSGFGRAKGMEGLRGYCKVKSVTARISLEID